MRKVELLPTQDCEAGYGPGAMTRGFTCQAIAQPFARLAIARFYVYGLLLKSTGLIAIHTSPRSYLYNM